MKLLIVILTCMMVTTLANHSIRIDISALTQCLANCPARGCAATVCSIANNPTALNCVASCHREQNFITTPVSKTCPGQFECGASGDKPYNCIPAASRCDGNADCTDGFDEKGCDGACYNKGFHCGDFEQKCIDASEDCNGSPDCKDRSDEFDCGGRCSGKLFSTYGPYFFNCTDGECGVRCNGIVNCKDGSDELDCKGKCWYIGGAHCGDQEPVCVQGCNGNAECIDGSDELGCNGICLYERDRFHCGDHQPWCTTRCDGNVRCKDGADEQNCGTLCNGTNTWGENLMSCPKDGFCALKCDDSKDCDDNADEINCY